jgi:hypothetical protein
VDGQTPPHRFTLGRGHRNGRIHEQAIRRGPKADLLKIRGKGQDAIEQSLQKKKPPEGWPK